MSMSNPVTDAMRNFAPDYMAEREAAGKTCSGQFVNSLNVILGIGVLVTAILALAGPLSAHPQLASGIILGAGALGTLSFIATPLRSSTTAWSQAIIMLIIQTAIWVPGILGLYSSTVVGWVALGPLVGALGLVCLYGYSSSAKVVFCGES